MKKSILALCLFLSIAPNNLLAQEHQQVTASDYCDFLNDTAVADPHHLYNEQMSSDPQAACIVRVGVPGRWHYEVIAGRENYPIHYVSHLLQISCAYRLQVSSSPTSTSSFDSHIEDVSCNNDSFEIEVPSTLLTLVSSSFPTSTSNFDSYISDVSAAVGLLALVALGHEFVTLEDFRTAATTHPPEQRLIITGEAESATIQPVSNVMNRTENLHIAKILIANLKAEYPGVNVQEIVDELVPKTGLIKSRPDLTSAKLKEILRRVERDAAASLDETVHSCATLLSDASKTTTASMEPRHKYEHLTLEHFIETALENPIAGRIVIDAGDSEMLSSTKANLLKLLRSETQQQNREATLTFKDLLRGKYGWQHVSRLLPGQDANYYPSLTSTDIFRYIHTIEDRVTKEIIKPGEKSDINVLEDHLPGKQKFAEQVQHFYEKYEEAFKNKKSGKISLRTIVIGGANAIAEELGEAKVAGTSVGKPIKLIVRIINTVDEYVETISLGNVEAICKGVQKDLKKVQEKIDKLRKRQELSTTRVTYEGHDPLPPEPLSNEPEITDQDDVTNSFVISSISITPSHERNWNNAIRFEKEADTAYERAEQLDTLDIWLDCKAKLSEAEKLWQKAAKAKEETSLKANNEVEINQLMADADTARSRSHDAGKKAQHATKQVNKIRLSSNTTPIEPTSPSDDFKTHGDNDLTDTDPIALTFQETKEDTATTADPKRAQNVETHTEQKSEPSDDLNAIRTQIAQLKLEAAHDAENADQAWSKNKSDQGMSWYRAENAKRYAIEELSAAIKAEEIGKISEGAAWRRIAEQRLLVSTEFQQAAAALGREAYELEEAKNAWRNALNNMRSAVQQMRLIQVMREQEAITADHLPEAEKWREVIIANEKAAQYYAQAIEALTLEKLENCHDFYRAGDGLDWASYRLVQAIEARAVGTPEKLQEAMRWDAAARESQKRSEYSLKAIEARATGKAEDATSWVNVADGAYWAFDRLVQAIEARGFGTPEKLEEATGYEEAARESQKRSEYFLKVIEARAAGKAEDATSWENAGHGASFASDRLAKAIEARALGTPEKLEEATGYEEAAH
ncbi:MAG: hypothetical protein ACH346_01725, partial [Chthoniobacterales bacterium]